MNATDFQLLEHAYERAATAANSDRAAIIAELRSRSPDAASKLSEMLEASSIDEHTASGLLLELGMGESKSARGLHDHHPPQIDKYRILSTLGEGGWGIVYLAEQPAPAHRLVAIKVIKPGMDSRQVLARFNDERQALAMMDHPCIVSSLDAGMTAQGRPYVVMPLVAGLPINRFCKEENLSITDRLILMAQVCRGIEYAHAKGVIHRDIKPGNILVTRAETGPIPRIIDFGLAKAMSQPLTPHATVTLSGQIIGTPDYMSPEQSRGEGADVRSDVYSLGAVLYELLAGRTPFDATKLRESGPDGLRAILLNTVPAAPSSVATEPLARELDWIVLRCLEKDANRRYPTAAALADDIERFLRGDRVNAGPPARLYRATRWVVKNRIVVVAALLIATSIAAGFWYTQQARARAEQVAKVTRSILTSVDPAVAQGRDTELLFLMLDQSKTLLDDPNLDPRVELDLRETFALANDATGRWPEAALHAKQADALICGIEGRNSLRRLEMLRILLVETTVVLGDRGDPGADLVRIGTEMRRVVRAHAQPGSDLDLRNEVALARIISGGPLYQEPDQRRALLARVESRFGPSDPDTIRLMRSLAKALADRKINGAIEMLEEARRRALEAYGAESPLVHEGIASEIYTAQEFNTPMERVDALAEMRFPAAEKILGWRHRSIAVAGQNYAANLVELGRCNEGIAALKKALDRENLNRGRDSGMAQWICGTLAYAAIKCQDWDLFTECETQLWEVQPESPAIDTALYNAILLEMNRRGDIARFDRWMSGLERRNPGRAAEFMKRIATQQRFAEVPAPRTQHAMTFDEARGVTVLFGGTDTGANLGDTWEWDGKLWKQRPIVGPPSREYHAMTFDAGRGVVVLFGGTHGAIRFGDTWEWNGVDWRQRVVSGPSPRGGHAMAYDAARGVTVLFGGNSGAPGFFNETWEYDGTAWTQRMVTGPRGRSNFAMAYDQGRHVTVLFGGTKNGAGAGTGVLGDTWEWDGTNWNLSASSGPAAREYFTMVYDTARKVTMLLGGFTHSINGEVWEWDGASWTQQQVAGLAPRHSHAMAFDVTRNTTVLFSGQSADPLPNADTWELASPRPTADLPDAPRTWTRSPTPK